jgi:hypothetical protein
MADRKASKSAAVWSSLLAWLSLSERAHAKASHGHSLAAAQLPLQQRSTTTSDIVRTQYVPLDDDSDSSDMEMEVHLMRKYGIKS